MRKELFGNMWLLMKQSFKRIKDSLGRFLSLFFIVALGVGFFAGIRSTSEDMFLTADQYFDENELFDYKIVSTYGLTEEDIDSLKELTHTDKVIGSYSLDVIVGSDVYRVHSIEEEMNHLVLEEGRLPQNENECVAEVGYHEIGDVITFHESVDGQLKSEELTVVGTAKTPLYIGLEKGITTVGNGKLASFLYVLKDSFVMDYYTEAYLIGVGSQDTVSYEDEYDEVLAPLLEELQELKPIRETLRYEEVLEEATAKIEEAENKIKEEEAKTQVELDNAKKEIDAAKQQIEDGKNSLNYAENVLSEKETLGYQQIEQAKAELNAKETEYQNNLAYYNEHKDEISARIEEGKKSLALLKQQVDELQAQIDQMKEEDPDNPLLAELESQYQNMSATYNQNLETLTKEEEEFNRTPILLEQAKKAIEDGKIKIEEEESRFYQEISSAKKELASSRLELQKNETLLAEKEQEYEDGLADFQAEIDRAYAEIADQKKALEELPKPEWYLLDRTDQTGYTDFKNDALRVDNIAKVFPVFFLLVAALVCLNTMTRMVEEDRTQIGIFKALGYSNGSIMFGYFLYVTIATFFGGVIGLLVGYQLLPRVIYSIYAFTYSLPSLVIHIDPVVFLVIIGVALLLTNFVTWFSCHTELKVEPANLLRPKAPKKGKKVFLEYITFIWNRLNFSGKVTVRNLFRYKKRIFMTVIGIAGCTALTLTGFGLRDGISSIVPKQYEELFTYDTLSVLNSEETTVNTGVDQLLQENHIINPLYVRQELYNFEANDKQHDFYLIVPENMEQFKEYIHLRVRTSGEEVSLDDSGAIITEKMASLLGVKEGDTIRIRNSDNRLFFIKVSGIVENYTYHYVYMTPSYYEKVMETSPLYNTVYGELENFEMDHDTISTNLIESGLFLSNVFTEDSVETFDTIITSLNKIVIVILGASCLLAFIVLYNLTNINVMERQREIATLKVLGFYDREVSGYVYRETMILTVLGIFVGLFLGVFLHRFVMDTAEMDFIMFIKEIKLESYWYAGLITLLFSIVVAIVTHFKLKKIDMIESLKSVE